MRAAPPGRTIIIGNEKGGSGKSTVAVHVVVGLLRLGYRVGSVDVDSRQGTLTRFLQNRANYRDGGAMGMVMPEHCLVRPDSTQHEWEPPTGCENRIIEADEASLAAGLERLALRNDYVVVDTPGSDSALSRLSHSHADVLVTPINDSLVDFDVLGTVDGDTGTIIGPSHYAEMVWEQKKVRARRDRRSIDWIVMRNRLSSLESRNMRDIADLVDRLSKRIGFRIVPGFGERVIFRELFLKGLTLLDLGGRDSGVKMTMSHIAGRSELRGLLEAILSSPALDGDRSLGTSAVGANL